MQIQNSSWFAVPSPQPDARHRLVLFAHAGGGPSNLRGWPERFAPAVEVVIAQLPGRESRFREPALADWRPLVAALADAIPQGQSNIFFGHSLGAVIAFELTRELRRRGGPVPSHLVVAGLGAVHLPNRLEQTHQFPDADFRESLRRRNGTPSAVLDNAELMDVVMPMLRADFRIMETYSYRPEPALGVPITAVGGLDDPTVTESEIAAWSELTTGRFEYRMFPGDHFFPRANPAPVWAEIDRVLATETWPAAAEPPMTKPNVVHVWRLNLDQSESEITRLADFLDDGERERAKRFHQPQHGARFIAGRGQLRLLLGQYLGQEPCQIRFRYGPAGKPELDGRIPLHFNLSHSADVALLAVSQRQCVGVDVERIEPTRDLDGLAERFFARREAAAIRALPPEERCAAFYTCWTRKEAYLKAHGGGLSVGLDGFEVLPLAGPPVLSVSADPAEARRWSLRDLAPHTGFAAALAVEGKAWSLWCGSLQ